MAESVAGAGQVMLADERHREQGASALAGAGRQGLGDLFVKLVLRLSPQLDRGRDVAAVVGGVGPPRRKVLGEIPVEQGRQLDHSIERCPGVGVHRQLGLKGSQLKRDRAGLKPLAPLDQEAQRLAVAIHQLQQSGGRLDPGPIPRPNFQALAGGRQCLGVSILPLQEVGPLDPRPGALGRGRGRGRAMPSPRRSPSANPGPARGASTSRRVFRSSPRGGPHARSGTPTLRVCRAARRRFGRSNRSRRGCRGTPDRPAGEANCRAGATRGCSPAAPPGGGPPGPSIARSGRTAATARTPTAPAPAHKARARRPVPSASGRGRPSRQ